MRIVFMGTPNAAVASLQRIVQDGHEVLAVYTQPDRPAGRGHKLSVSSVKQFAIDHHLPVCQPTKIRTPEAFAEFKSFGADVAVVVAYGRILPESFLTAFPNGAINVHFSLLPKYRGAAPVNWAIVNGEETTGVTTMQMDAGLDTGPILLQRETPIGVEETSVQLMERLAVLGAELLSETLANYNNLEPREQDHASATLAPIMKKEDGLIDWTRPATEIEHRVRGFQPFPSAHTHLGEKRLTIWNAANAQSDGGPDPGTVVQASGDSLLIACGDSSILRIKELQLEGKRRMDARDFINGVRPKVGEKLGNAEGA